MSEALALSRPLTLRLHPADPVVLALADIEAGAALVEGVPARERIPRGHKAAVRDVPMGAPVSKYGQVIGVALEAIPAGAHVHTHNLGMSTFDRDYAFSADYAPVAYVSEAARATFQGYVRANGKVGTRNYIGIVTSVNCSATVAKHIQREVERRGLLDRFPSIDGVVAISHGAGCCVSTKDEGFHMLQRTVWGHARHPNFGAALMLGLGCEANQIAFMLDRYGKPEAQTFQHMTIQQEGGTRATIERALAWIEAIAPTVAAAERSPVPASELMVALQCGGSDGYSGITANPALGAAVDRLVRHGGTAILAETPEVYGAEHLLTRRAVSREVGEKLVARLRWWEEYASKLGGEMNNNPTPGNKAGGLTTILEKSLGAVAKGGSTPLMGVYEYAEPVEARGFVFMDSPGYDPCSITGEVASGANLIAFTTGRGSVYGNKPVPSIKLATNTPMYERMREDMDVNCGAIVDGGRSVDDMGEEIFQLMLRVASGEATKSEALGFGDSEFVPWQISAQM